MEKQITILILEDNPADAELMKRALRNSGTNSTIHVAHDKKAFLDLLDSLMPSLVLADYSLPGYNGLAAAEEVRRRFTGVPVILVSGVVGEEFATEAIKAGAADYILKKNLNRLWHVVHRALDEAARAADTNRAEEALRQSEERFRLLVEQVKDYAIFMLDTGGRIITWNSGAQRLKGYSTEEIMGKHFSCFYPPDSFDAPNRELDTAALEGQWTGEGWRVRKDGSRFWANVTITALRNENGGLRGFAKITRDITDRKLAEEAVLRAKEEWERTFDAVPDLIAILDENHHIVRVNRAMAGRLGVTPDQCVNLPCYKAVHGADAPPVFCPHSRTLIDGQEHAAEVHEERLGGDFLVSTNPMHGPDGKLTGTVHVARDITERKRAEQELRRNSDQLAAANRELEAFSYSVSHDLRAPLRAIRGFSDILLKGYHDKVDEEGQDFLRRIIAGADKMGELIDDMLSLARISRQEMTPQEIDLGAIALTVVNGLLQAEPGRKVEVVIADALTAYGDARLMSIALSNLIGNAWKYSGKTPDAVIEFGAAEEHGEKVYFVRDNGVGFDMTQVHRLFAPFQRLHPEREFPGTGIGLAIVNRVIQRHGGRIWAESEVGRGATFRFTLPPGDR